MEQEWLECEAVVPWASYCAQQVINNTDPVSVYLMPLLKESVQSFAVVRRALWIVMQAIETINPAQTPVITADQPVYAIAKQLQWRFPEDFGEHKLVVMMGGLHIEMAILRMIGVWLEGSGWINLLVSAGVTTKGRAEAILVGGHVKRSRYAHQVSLFAFHRLLQDAWNSSETRTELQHWIEGQRAKAVNFEYWTLAMELQMLLLRFIRSPRTPDFELFRQTIKEIIPWLFALDRGNYARWLPVFSRDLNCLSKTHPGIFEEFCKGNFSGRKTRRPFSSISDDQIHEQENKLIKDQGGAVGLFNKSGLLNWMVAGPEMARMVSRLNTWYMLEEQRNEEYHHEDTEKSRQRFCHDVDAFYKAMKEIGNPFMETELTTLHTCQKVSYEAQRSVKEATEHGREKAGNFIYDCLITGCRGIREKISRSSLQLFHQQTCKSSKTGDKMQALKEDCNLFSRLFIACRNRDGDLSDFFNHENQPFPPSISECGRLRPAVKSDLVKVLESLIETVNVEVESPPATVEIIDGAALVHIIEPSRHQNFGQYCDRTILGYLKQRFQHVSRIDLIFDTYSTKSLKSEARIRRGQGSRFQVREGTPVPAGDWKNFLQDNENKEELFQFLAKRLVHKSIPENKILLCTAGPNVVCSSDYDLGSLMPCNHEEADSRIFLHLLHAKSNGHHEAIIRTVDTDVVILAVSFYFELDMEHVFVDFGTGKTRRYLNIQAISHALGQDKCLAFPFFHALTGCDTVSSFFGHGKKSAWSTWRSCEEATSTFQILGNMPTVSALEDNREKIERFVSAWYDKTTVADNVNECRYNLFTKKNTPMEKLPPTSDALFLHVQRAAFQAGYVWKQSLVKNQSLPSPTEMGWTETDIGYQPLWTTLSPIGKSSNYLLKCSCKTNCGKRCSCVRAILKCTQLCQCDAHCSRD